MAESRLTWLAAGGVCGIAAFELLTWVAARRAMPRASKEELIVGQDFCGQRSTYIRSTDQGVVGLLAYNVCQPLTEAEYDKWLFDIHYHDLMANPHLEKIVLHTVSKDKKAHLSSGSAVKNEFEFFRLAELHFQDYAAYSEYTKWFQANAIPPPRTPAGKSAFKFYLLSEGESILRPALASQVPRPHLAAPISVLPQRQTAHEPKVHTTSGDGTVVLVVGSTGNVGMEVVQQLKERGGVTVFGASRSGSGLDTVPLDIYSMDSVKSLDAALPDGVDHVVVCCGASTFGPIGGFDSQKWEENISHKLLAVSRLIVMLANGNELRCLRAGGSITVTAGQASRTVNKMWPGIAANNAGLEAMVRCAGIDAPRGVRINAVAPALVHETALKAGLPLEGTVPAAEAAAAYLPLVFGSMSGQVVDAGIQTAFTKSHHDGQKDGVTPAKP